MQETGITLKQLTNWMVNNRKRLWKPKIEARLQQQARAAVAAVAAQAHAAALTAVTLAQHAAQNQEQAPASAAAANPVTPEAGLKPTVTMPAPSGNGFVRFDVESSDEHKLAQLHPISTQPPLPPASDAATRALQLLIAQQQQAHSMSSRRLSFSACDKSPAMISEHSSTASLSASEESASDSIPEPGEESVVDAVASTKEVDTKSYARNVSFSSLELVSGFDDSNGSSSPAPSSNPVKPAINVNNKRVRSTASSSSPSKPAVVTPRKKYRRVSLDVWVDACSKASHTHDESLPSFEEASRLFGYAK